MLPTASVSTSSGSASTLTLTLERSPVLSTCIHKLNGVKGWGLEVVRYVINEETKNKSRSQVDEVEQIVVQTVHENSPASDAGVKAGDVIIQVFGAPFSSSEQLHNIMKHSQRLELTLLRRNICSSTSVKSEVKSESTRISKDEKLMIELNRVSLLNEEKQDELQLMLDLRAHINATSKSKVSESTKDSPAHLDNDVIDLISSSESEEELVQSFVKTLTASVNQGSSECPQSIATDNDTAHEKHQSKHASDIAEITKLSKKPEVCKTKSKKLNANRSERDTGYSTISTGQETNGDVYVYPKSDIIFVDDENATFQHAPSNTIQSQKSWTKSTMQYTKPQPVAISNSKPFVSVPRGVSNIRQPSRDLPAAGRESTVKRLWPDALPFYKKMLRWKPPMRIREKDGIIRFRGSIRSDCSDNMSVQDFSPIPSTFKDSIEMLNTYVPYILEEGKRSIGAVFAVNADKDKYWTRKSLSMRIQSCICVEPNSTKSQKVYELRLLLDNSRAAEKDIMNGIGDLYAVSSGSWRKSSCCMGLVGVCDPITNMYQRYDDRDVHLKLLICVSDQCEETGWLSPMDLPSMAADGLLEYQQLQILCIGNVCPTIREYEGIKGSGHISSHLRRTLYGKLTDLDDGVVGSGESASLTDRAQNIPTIRRPQSLPEKIWDALSRELNPYQLSSIEKVMVGKTKNNMMLLQGPPGTGKTKTITGLVTALLNGGCPQVEGVVSGVKVKIGLSLPNSASHGRSTIKSNDRKTRILVCAPSNTAVDDLAWRIHQCCIGADGKIGHFNIVRLGNTRAEEKITNSSLNSKYANTWMKNTFGKEEFLHRIHIDQLMPEDTFDKRKVIMESDIVCTTVNGAGSKALIEASYRGDGSGKSSEFDVVIIDEACQASEHATLIPLKYNPKVVVMVGDPQQLPVFSRMNAPKSKNFGRSLFQRLQLNGFPVDMLKVQYRMHPDIAMFPSRQFYGNQLITSNCVRSRDQALWHQHICFPPFLVWNLEQGRMVRNVDGGTFNREEDSFILRKILRLFSQKFGQHPGIISIGIISFYNEQVGNIRSVVRELKLDTHPGFSIQVSSVDGFQGAEKDIIILSCVRSKMHNNCGRGIGFLNDHRRMNVAFTRARQSFWVVGNCNVLSKDNVWKSMLDCAYQRNMICSTEAFDNLVQQSNGNDFESQRSYPHEKRGYHPAGKKNGKRPHRHERNKFASKKRKKQHNDESPRNGSEPSMGSNFRKKKTKNRKKGKHDARQHQTTETGK